MLDKFQLSVLNKCALKRNQRILAEILLPPFLAVIYLAMSGFAKGSEDWTDYFFILSGIIPLLFFAYLFGIIPSTIYALVIELWFRLGLSARLGLFCTVILSSVLGAGCGILCGLIGIWLGFLTMPDPFSLMRIGILVGLTSGFYIGRKEKLQHNH